MSGRRLSWGRTVLVMIGAAAAAYAAAVNWNESARAAGLDFYIYFVNAQIAARNDVPNIYAADEQARLGEEFYGRAADSGSELQRYDATRRRRLDSVSSPFLYTTLRWVSRDYDVALQQYHALVLAAFIVGFVLTARAARLPWTVTFFLLAAILLFFRGFEADLRVGNVNSLQLLAFGVVFTLSIGAVTPRRWLPAGVVLGMLLMFKPNILYVPLLIGIARLASHEYRRLLYEMAGAVAGAAGAIVAAAASYGTPAVWLQWFTAAGEFWGRLPSRAERNVTPLLPLLHDYGEWTGYLSGAILVAIAAAAIWRGCRGAMRCDEILIAGIGLLIYLLAANVVWLHYMVLVLPAAIALMRWRATAVIALLALACIAEEPFEWITGRSAFPVEAWLITPALAALYAASVWKVSHRDPAAA